MLPILDRFNRIRYLGSDQFNFSDVIDRYRFSISELAGAGLPRRTAIEAEYFQVSPKFEQIL